MHYTNNYNLPASIYNALTTDDYDLVNAPENIISVTTLIDAPKARILQKRYWSELKTDAVDNLWKLFGGAIHHVLESKNKNHGYDSLSEERWFLDVANLDVYTLRDGEGVVDADWYSQDLIYVSGKFDNYTDDMAIEDYKVTSVWSYIFEPNGKPEHHWQININAFAMRLLQFPVNKGRIIMILRDFQNSKAGIDNYPNIPIQTIDIPLKDGEDVLTYIESRVALYQAARLMSDDEIPSCSENERWYRGGKIAVMKDGRKSALKLFDDTDESSANAFLNEQSGGKFYIEYRPGTNVRCENYCDCNEFCDFYRSIKNV